MAGYIYKDFDTGEHHKVYGKFVGWIKGGPLNESYAVFMRKVSALYIPIYCIPNATIRRLPECPDHPRLRMIMCNWGWQVSDTGNVIAAFEGETQDPRRDSSACLDAIDFLCWATARLIENPEFDFEPTHKMYDSKHGKWVRPEQARAGRQSAGDE